MIDLAVVAKALNSIDLDDLLESFEQVKDLGKVMLNEDEQSHPLNQAMMRIFTNQPFMEAMQRKADRLGVELDDVLFPMLQGLLVGLITPVQLSEEIEP